MGVSEDVSGAGKRSAIARAVGVAPREPRAATAATAHRRSDDILTAVGVVVDDHESIGDVSRRARDGGQAVDPMTTGGEKR